MRTSIIILTTLTITLMARKTFAQELTWQQDEAVSDLKRVMRENLPLIGNIKSGNKVETEQVNDLVKRTETALASCADTSVPDNFSFETTNYSDNSKMTFTVSQIKSELTKWKSLAKSAKADEAKTNATAAKETAAKEMNEKYQYTANGFISSFDGRAELFEDVFVKKIQADDAGALSQLEEFGKFRLPTRMDMRKGFQGCIDAGISDGFVFNFGNGKKYTMAQLKTLVPKWALIAETAVFKADPSLAESNMPVEQRTARTLFENDFVSAMNAMDDVKKNVNVADYAYYQQWIIDPLKKSLVKAKQAQLPPSTQIGSGKPVAFSEAAKKAESFEKDFKVLFASKDDPMAVFKNTQTPANLKRYEAFRAKYVAGLSGDKLKVMEEILIKNVVYAQDPPQFLDQYFDVEKKKINTPADFANAKIWATTNHVYANTDVLKTDPHWRVYISHFDGMKLVNTSSIRGSGTVAPTSEFKFQSK